MKYKKKLKAELTKLFGSEFDELFESVFFQTNTISFDVFDTLIFRNCLSPETIFEITEYRFFKKNNFRVPFKKIRTEAQRNAEKKFFNKEITISEIYGEITEISQKEKEELYNLEIEAELDFCCINMEMKKIYDIACDYNKNIILTTDMYLPKEIIVRILNKCGIYKYSDIYVSCEQNSSKKSGELFKVILDNLNVDPRQMTHIGDDFISDYLVPKKIGVHSLLYKRNIDGLNDTRVCHRRIKDDKSLQRGILKAISNNLIIKDNKFNNVGVTVLGPLVYGFTTWLYNNLVQQNYDQVVFLAREGKILKEAFDSYYDNRIKTVYLNVSRLAVCRACVVKTSNYEDLVRLFSSMMRSINTSDELYQLVTGKENKKDAQECLLLNELNDDQKECLYQSIVSENKDFFQMQNELLCEYLNENGFKSEKIALVDIGWAGTMQLYINRLFPTKMVVGYYLAVNDVRNNFEYKALYRYGFLCNENEWKNKGQAIRFTLTALETLFMSVEGTTLGYEKNRGTVVPIKSRNSWAHSLVKKIDDLDHGCLRFINCIKEMHVDDVFNMCDAEFFFEPYYRFAVRPDSKTITFFKEFKFEDGIRYSAFIPKHNLIYYIKNFQEFRNELEANNSKIIWLKALLRIPFPYYTILLLLTDKLGMKSNYMQKYLN